MQIGILTYYGVHNHGAVLQANALKTVLNSMGHECGFLEFERSYASIPQQQAKKYKLGVGSIPFYFRYLWEKGIGNIALNISKKRTLGAFRDENLPMIGSYEAFEGDLVVIGSDEEFSLEIGVNPFLYGNGLRAKHVISYAGSFGPTTYEDIQKQDQQKMIADGLQHVDAVSVRDQNSQDIIRRLAGIKAELVCDPVILYGYENEMRSFSPPMKDYILIYAYDKNLNAASEYEPIKAYAARQGLRVVSVGFYHKWCKSVNADPIELLGWIRNAKLIVTDTFHGAVMSIICNTPAAVKLRGNQNKLRFLLSEYGLTGRIISDFTELESVAGQAVDFHAVNAAVEARRSASMRYLIESLRRCE